MITDPVFLVLACSLVGITAILVWRFRFIKNIKKNELFDVAISGRSFFADFEEGLKPICCRLFGFWGKVCEKGNIKGRDKIKKYFCKFSNYMHGRRSVVKNGCKGYWEKLNDYKNKKEE